MGRPASEIWQLYQDREGGGAECKACGKVFWRPQAQRLVNHIVDKCEGVSDDVKFKWASASSLKRKQPPTPSPGPKKKTPRRANSPSQPNQARFLIDIAFLFLVMGWSYRAIENPFFVDFAKKYFPGYKLPSRQYLADKLLHKIYAQEKEKVVSELKKHKHLSLAIDGYTDANGERVLNFILNAPGLSPTYWKSVRSEAESQTGVFISGELEKVISEVEDATGSRVYGLTTDNASNMAAAGRKLRQANKNILRVGCAAHAINLIYQAAFKEPVFDQIRECAVAVSKFVKKRGVVLAKFKHYQAIYNSTRKGLRSLALPVSTRWYSTHRCISSVLRNRSALRALFKDVKLVQEYEDDKKFIAASQSVRSVAFWERAEIVLKLIRPITKALARVEEDASTMSTVYEQFQILMKHELYGEDSTVLDPSLRLAVLDSIRARWKAHLQANPAFAAAFLLDPTTSYSSFPGEEGREAFLGFDGSSFERLKAELRAFIGIKTKWTEADCKAIKEEFGAITWWKTSKLQDWQFVYSVFQHRQPQVNVHGARIADAPIKATSDTPTGDDSEDSSTFSESESEVEYVQDDDSLLRRNLNEEIDWNIDDDADDFNQSFRPDESESDDESKSNRGEVFALPPLQMQVSHLLQHDSHSRGFSFSDSTSGALPSFSSVRQRNAFHQVSDQTRD